uniref:Transmembrane protein 186 n=1 Tax=Strongyloides venezuelensis TaxID=75913 RepID=A0A0K0F1Y4_STRVS
MAARQASLEALSRQQGVVQNNYRNNIYRSERSAAMLRKKKGAGDTVLNFRKQNSPQKQNPYEKSEILNRIGGTCIRKIHTTSKMNKKEISNLKEMVDDLNFTPIYRFHGIWVGAFLAKAKLIQTIASLFLLPYATYKLYIGTYNFENFMVVSLISILAPILLFAFARFYSRIIGVISMSECNEYIRVGYLSFFGTRQNRYIKVEDVVPLNETTSTTSKHMIVPFYQNSRKDYLYLATKGVEIVDEERASKLFGGLKIFHVDKKKI